MGKPSSLKISKNQSNHIHSNSPKKVVKPKVYITHSSNFMALVQKVTGKDSSSSSSSIISSSFSPDPPAATMVSPEPPRVIHIDDDHGSPDTSLDFVTDPCLDNMFMQFDYSYSSSDPSQVVHLNDHESPDPSLDNTFMASDYSYRSSDPTQVVHLNDHESPDPSLDNTIMQSDYSYGLNSTDQEWQQQQQQQQHDDGVMDYVSEIQLRNLESWLLDFDPSASIHDGSFVPMNTYEYGYDLSSIM